MKTRHLFTVALAAFAFAACSQDDTIDTSNPDPGQVGALVEGISINFGESKGSSKTRAYAGNQIGEGSEGRFILLFLFLFKGGAGNGIYRLGNQPVAAKGIFKGNV